MAREGTGRIVVFLESTSSLDACKPCFKLNRLAAFVPQLAVSFFFFFSCVSNKSTTMGLILTPRRVSRMSRLVGGKAAKPGKDELH